MGDEGRRGLRNVLLAAVPGAPVYLMEAAVSGKWVVEAWHAAMETALLSTSVNHRITPDGLERETGADLNASESHQLTDSVLRVLSYLSSRGRRRLLW